MTYEDLRRRLIELTGVPAEDFDADGDLVDFGLDSMQVFELMAQWRDQGYDVDLARLAETPTLNGWWRLLRPQCEASS